MRVFEHEKARHKELSTTTRMTGEEFMIYAAFEVSEKKLRKILREGASANCMAGRYLHGPMKHAAVNGHIEAMKLLL